MSSKRKNKNKNKKKGKAAESDSSTPQSSTASNDDDQQQLLGSRSRPRHRESRCPEKSKDKRTSSHDKSPNKSRGVTFTGPIAASDQGRGKSSSRSPLKSSIANTLSKVFSPKKSSTRFTDTDCSIEDNSNKDSGISDTQIPAGAKLKSPKGRSPKRSKSPSSSDPSSQECSKTLKGGMSYLTVPSQNVGIERGSPVSPPRGVISKLVSKFTPKSPNRSPDCNCVDKNDHRLGCPAGTKSETGAISKVVNPSGSGTSSSSNSPRNQRSDTSGISSGTSQRKEFKSSSASDRSLRDDFNRFASDRASGSSTDSRGYGNPEEQSGKSKVNLEQYNPLKTHPHIDDRITNEWNKPYADGEDIGDQVMAICNLNIGQDNESGSRRRTKTFPSTLLLGLVPSRPSTREDTRSESDNQSAVDSESAILHSPVEELDRSLRVDNVCRLQVGDSPTRSRRSPSDGSRIAVASAASRSVSPRRPASRIQSLSPHPLDCDCRSPYLHGLHCSREILARRRRKQKKCKQDVYKPPKSER